MPRIVVIGAGPAGTVAAICLGPAVPSCPLPRYSGGGLGWGSSIANRKSKIKNPNDPHSCPPPEYRGRGEERIEVVLIEQHHFPRDKVCGECLSALGIDILNRIGLHDRVLSLQPAILHRAIVYNCNGDQAEFHLPRPMWGISRLKLDSILLDAARDAGVQLLQPARCEAILPNVRVRMLETNELRTIDADHIIVADGKGTLLPCQNGNSSHDLGLKAHFQNISAPDDAIELFGVDGHYGGIAPIEDGLWNIAFSVPARRFKEFSGNLDALFSAIVAENVSLSRQMETARRTTDWLVSPLPRFPVARSWPEKIIPIGNSAAALEPIGGEGMGLAMRSAELAAEAIADAINSGSSLNTAKLRRQYQKLWTMRQLVCRIGGRIISSPDLSRLTFPFAGRSDGPMSLALRLAGK